MLGVAGIPALLQFIGLCFLPESPRWLFLKEKQQQAMKVLKTLMPPEEVSLILTDFDENSNLIDF